MIRIILLAALAAHVSCQNPRIVTKNDYCNRYKYDHQTCDRAFQTHVRNDANLQKCTSEVYSTNCELLRTETPVQCTGRKCNNPGIQYTDTINTFSVQPEPEGDIEVPKPSVTVDRKVLDFSLRLFQKAFPSDDSSNYIISPIMVQLLLSYLIDGASNNTRQEMETALQLNVHDLADIGRALRPSAENGEFVSYKLDTASQIYKSTTIELLDAYRETLKRNKVPLQEMDFSNRRLAVETINGWVQQQTRGKILEVIDEKSLDPQTELLLMNAIFFNGTWMNKFTKTERGQFHRREGQQASVRMMHLTQDLRNGITNLDDWSKGMTWVELPYDGDRVSMILLLPQERFQLDRELRDFTVQQLERILADIELNEPGKTRVNLPEFKADSAVSLVQPLKQMGMASMFSENKPFDRISQANVKISDIKQKSFLTVNPHGTVAASVNLAGVIPLSISRYMDFIADQPFAAIIIDKQKRLPLFFAKITQPLKIKAKKTQSV